MLWPVLALAVALLVPLVTDGSYARLLEKPWRWSSFLAAGLAVQLALDILPVPESRWHDIGFGLLVMSYVLLLAFCARNALIRGMSVVFLGIALNTLVILVNQGMPVKVPPDWAREDRVEATIKHHPREDGDHLLVLSDIILLRAPFNTVLSFGDLILAVGLCDVTYHASRRPRRRRTGRGARPGYRVAEPALDADEVFAALDMRRGSGDTTPVGSDVLDDVPFDDDGERIDDDRVVRVHGG